MARIWLGNECGIETNFTHNELSDRMQYKYVESKIDHILLYQQNWLTSCWMYNKYVFTFFNKIYDRNLGCSSFFNMIWWLVPWHLKCHVSFAKISNSKDKKGLKWPFGILLSMHFFGKFNCSTKRRDLESHF